jgi:hypothetical protein
MDPTPEQLQAEIDSAVAMAPAATDPGAVPISPSVADMGAGYSMIAAALLDTTCELTVPAWEITTDEKTKLADAIGNACALWFPGEIPPKWAALIVLAGAAGQIAMARRDPATGGFRPRFRPPVAEAKSGAGQR